MIKSVTVTNYLNEKIILELAHPEKSGFYIKEITGLGPPNANINTTDVSTNDGALYNSARVTSRNIVMTLGFLADPMIEDVRQLSYRYFPIKKLLKLSIQTHNRNCEIYGYVESNEPDIFSSQQTTQISIICPLPYFHSKEPMLTVFNGVTPMFEFPFSNESLTQDLIVMGEMNNGTTQSIEYFGDAETGVLISIYIYGDVSTITIFDVEQGHKMEINTDRIEQLTGSSLVEGDRIIISTVKGDKYITLIRDGETINILNCLNKNAYWFQLVKGSNIFAYNAVQGLVNIVFRIENKIVYEGV